MYNPEAFVKHKDLPNFTTIFGNKSNSWDNALPNDLYIKGVPKCIFKDAANPKLVNGGNVGGGLDTIFVLNIPAGSFKGNLDFVDGIFAGNFAANDNDKRIVSAINGTTQEDTGLIDLDAAIGWTYLIKIIRLSSTSIIVNSVILGNAIATTGAEVLIAFATGSVMISRTKIFTALADLDANALTIEIKAEGTANDDIIISLATLNLTRF